MTAPIPTLGIVGAGQLARMMLQSAVSLGLRVRLLAERPDDSAVQIWPHTTIGSPDSLDVLREFAAGCDVLTFDHELVPPEHLAALESEGRCLRPGAAALRYAQDKGYQREQFHALGLPVPPFHRACSADDMAAFGDAHGWPIMAKACRGGYDGRGVWVLAHAADARSLWQDTRAADLDLIVEQRLALEREIAVLVARRPGGEAVVYPVVETVQVDGMCAEVLAPADLPDALAASAQRLGLEIAAAIGAAGILAVELFIVQGGLIVNEIALRPHNSGHFSIEGAVTSQFENHLRAVLDLPLGSTALRAPAVAMANIVGARAGGDPVANLSPALAADDVHVHLYGKASRPGRKLGHVTALGDTISDGRGRAQKAAALLSEGPLNLTPDPSPATLERGASATAAEPDSADAETSRSRPDKAPLSSYAREGSGVRLS